MAVVTGAASGLGIAFSEAMAYAGADVVCADVDEGGLARTVGRVEGFGRKALAVRCDVTDEESVRAMVEKTKEEFGRLDILFNNAAKGAVVNLTREMGLQYADKGINVNAICPGFFFSRLAGGAYDDPGFVEAVRTFTPAGRVADAEEIKGLAIMLASEASDYMCGQMFVIDGGCLAK